MAGCIFSSFFVVFASCLLDRQLACFYSGHSAKIAYISSDVPNQKQVGILGVKRASSYKKLAKLVRKIELINFC